MIFLTSLYLIATNVISTFHLIIDIFFAELVIKFCRLEPEFWFTLFIFVISNR